MHTNAYMTGSPVCENVNATDCSQESSSEVILPASDDLQRLISLRSYTLGQLVLISKVWQCLPM